MNRKNQVSSLIITALLATISGSAFAEDAQPREDRRAAAFAEMDANADGSVSAEEFDAGTNMFARADADGDGLLTKAEIADSATRMAERMIARFDKNGDGSLSQDEIKPRRDPARMFKKLDANGDGIVSAEEFSAAGKGYGKGKGREKGHENAKPYGKDKY